MDINVALPYNLKWDMSPQLFIKTLEANGFDYDKGFSAFYGSFNWPDAPNVISGCDIVISNEEQQNEPLDFLSMMLFPEDERYSEDDEDVYNKIAHDQQAIFDYFVKIYGPFTDEGERMDDSSGLTTLYKAWAFENLFITVAVDKIDEDNGLDEPAFVLSLTFSQDDE